MKWAYCHFPYIEWVEEVAHKRLPQSAQNFFDETWTLPAPKRSNSVDFFNFLKIRINAIDEKSAREVWGAESITRYVASSLYALVFSWVLAGARLAMVAVGRWPYQPTDTAVWLVFWAYLVAILALLRNLRFMRIKEVLTLFAATFQHRDKL
jgi:hypothetical protein